MGFLRFTRSRVFFFALVIFSLTNAQEVKRFTLLDAEHTQVTFNNEIKDSNDQNILIYANFYGGAGVGIGDFNSDGLRDLYFAGNMVPDKLYLNQGDLTFKDVTKASGITDDGGWSTGVTIADVNNDGYSDIYVSRELYDDKPEWRTNLLYINNGDGTFTESAKKFGVADSQRTRHATFLDYDKDGLLDLFLLTQPPNPGSYSEHFGSELLNPEYHLKLFKNTGKDAFVDVSEAAKINLTGFPNGVSASDINNDGWTDIYVANDFNAPDFLFVNNRDGTFTNIANSALNHMSFYSMGVDIADINNDGLLDIFVLDMVAEDNFRSKSNMSGMNPKAFWKVVDEGGHYQYMYNTLHLNNGNTTFSDVAQITGMAATDWSWSNLIADFDNDGLKDTFVTNGLLYDIRNTDADKKVASYINKITYDYVINNPDGGNIKSIWEILDLNKVIAMMPSQPLKNYAFKNLGDLKFEKVMEEWGLDQESFSNGGAYADLDNDGDLDIVVNNINSEAFIYRNNSEKFNDSNYLRLNLSDKDNQTILGAKVTLYADEKTQLYETSNVRGIYSTSEPLVHFGLGSTSEIDSLIITWPNGAKTIKRKVKANQTLPISMNEAVSKEYEPKNHWTALFFTDDTESFTIQHKHQENPFDDYAYQVLLPHKMSQFGPALAKGDINNDGLDDVFIGGAKGLSAALHVQDESGAFVMTLKDLWEEDKDQEDIDALFVDINGDGHQDLYVVSGGNEFPENDPKYEDRLYLNDGKGNLTKTNIKQMDPISGAVVKASDYDNDGDIDLFVGGRHVPRQYPLPASSMLLINENGQLTNATKKLAKDLQGLGMVTDASWSDYDNDGDIDLIVVGEWMPITFFKNEQGMLTIDSNNGLADTSGWWFSIEKGDFDNDGDMDFICGNLGLNYKYKTSANTPFDIYYNDFDGNGKYDIVLGYYNQNKHYPLRGFSCSSEQIPGLKKKFKEYDVFATLELDEVYGERNLEKSLHLKAKTFASSYLENLGNGKFVMSVLPNMAQLSNINDIKVMDIDHDGNLDVLALGNLFVSEIETPRNDAGTGLVLLGDGTGKFQHLNSWENGFFVNKDAKKMIRVKTKGSTKILVANNDDKLQCFSVVDK